MDPCSRRGAPASPGRWRSAAWDRGVAQGPQSVSLQGVSVNFIGIANTAGSGVSSGGGIVTQLGPALLNLDPTVTYYANFQHATIPESNTILAAAPRLWFKERVPAAQYQQN